MISRIANSNVIGGRDNVKIVRASAGRIAAEEDLGTILLEGVVKRVENFWRDEVPRHEHIGSLERLRVQHIGGRERYGD